MIHKFSRYLLTLVALLAMTTGAWAEGETATITLTSGQTMKTYENVTLPWSTTAEILKEVISDYKNVASNIDAITGGDGKVVKYGNEQFKVTGTFSGDAKVVVSWYNSSTQHATITVTAPGPLMTLSDDGKTATMESMPTYDVTVDYELVRDMAVSMTTKVGDGEDGAEYRIRVKKDGESFVPAEMTLQEMMGLYKVHDGIENKDLVFYGDGKVCDLSIFAVDDQDQPTGDAIAFTALTPGRYVAIATAAEGSAYDGQTPASNIFVLYQGYEVTIPAGEYITYYRDEPLKLDDADKESIELYTVSSVTATEAVLSDPFDAAPANTPLLVYNKNTEEAKTILLIPCNEPDLALTVADAFKGTLDAKEFSKDDMEAANYYVCTGKQFVWVKSAGTIAANRCWLEISTAAPSNARKIVHGDATKITNTDRTDLTDGDLYDLNGRKVLNPTKKGIYIKNGRKVVIK